MNEESGEGAALDLEAARPEIALIQRGRAPGVVKVVRLRKHPRHEDEEIEAPGRIGGAPSRVGR